MTEAGFISVSGCLFPQHAPSRHHHSTPASARPFEPTSPAPTGDHESTRHSRRKQSNRGARISGLLALKSATTARLELAKFAPWPQTAHARAPDANHGAWVLPLAVEATTAAVVGVWSSQRACACMRREGPISGIGEKTVGLTFEGKIWSILACRNSPK